MNTNDNQWYEDMVRCGWQMPIVARWKRLPVIRHARALWHLYWVRRHYQAWRSVGLGAADTGYDSWVLYGMWRGREGNTKK